MCVFCGKKVKVCIGQLFMPSMNSKIQKKFENLNISLCVFHLRNNRFVFCSGIVAWSNCYHGIIYSIDLAIFLGISEKSCRNLGNTPDVGMRVKTNNSITVCTLHQSATT